jgi:hypothetical protein
MVGDASGATPHPWPEQWPPSLAPYAQVLQAHRGVPLISVQDRTAGSSQPLAVVTDTHGEYRVTLTPLPNLPANLPPGAVLRQEVTLSTQQSGLDSTREVEETVWTVNLGTGEVAWGPQTRTTTVTSKGFYVGPGAPGSFNNVGDALNYAVEHGGMDPASADHLRRAAQERGWHMEPPEAAPPKAMPPMMGAHPTKHHTTQASLAVSIGDICYLDEAAPIVTL